MKEYESIQTLLDPVRNFGKVTVSTGYTNLDTVIVLSTGDGARLPYPTTDGPFNLIWYNWSEYRDPADDPNREIIRVTARTGDIITVTRPEEGTTATNKNLIGRTYKMILSVTAKTISDLGLHGAPGTEVYNAAAPTVYTDLNLSAVVGARKALLILKVKNLSYTTDTNARFRQNGDTDSMAATTYTRGANQIWFGAANQAAYVMCVTDAAGIIEWINSNADIIQIWVMAWIALS